MSGNDFAPSHDGVHVDVDRATKWITEHLPGAHLTGEAVIRYVRPWAAVLSAETSDGVVWLKVPAPDNVFEAALYTILCEEAPGSVLTPLATDLESGWLLLPDGGPPLAEVAEGSDLVKAMVRALPDYAAIQRSMSSRVDELLSIGLPDMRPEGLPARFEEFAKAANVADTGLVAFLPRFDSWCRRLSASPIGPSIDHNDLHPWNILGMGGEHPRGRPLFYDWGDSVVAHPFGSSIEPIFRVRLLAGLDRGHRDVVRMRDAYLEVFDDVIPRSESVALIDVAWSAAKAARAVIFDGSEQAIRQYAELLAKGDIGV